MEKSKREDTEYIRVQPTYPIDSKNIKKVIEAELVFSNQEWERVCGDARRLGLPPVRLLEKRLKKIIQSETITGRIENSRDRQRLYFGYNEVPKTYAIYLI